MSSLGAIAKPIFSLSLLCCPQLLPPPGSGWTGKGDQGAEPCPGLVPSWSGVGPSPGSLAEADSFSRALRCFCGMWATLSPGTSGSPQLPHPGHPLFPSLTAALWWGLVILAGGSLGGRLWGATFSITSSARGQLSPSPCECRRCSMCQPPQL